MAGLSEAQSHFYRFFPKKPIAYQPGLSLALNSVQAGLFLSQLLYWCGKGSDEDGWIYKTIYEIEQETGLSRYQQATAIKVCKRYGFLETKLAKNPAKRHFRINFDVLEKQLASLKENANLVYPNPPYEFVEKQQTILTKSTQKTTTKNIPHGAASKDAAAEGRIFKNKKTKTHDVPINRGYIWRPVR